MNVLKSPSLRVNSFALGAVMSLLALCLPEPALAVRHWFTDENRHLVKTSIFEASVGKNTYCDPASRDTDVIVQLRFLSDIDFEVSNNPAYLQLVQSAIAPVVHGVCGEVTDLVILNFFSRPLKDRDGGEIPASRATFRNLLVPAYPAQVKWVWFDAIFAGKFPPANADSFGNDRLTTEHAIRSWLSKGSPDQLIAEFEKGLAAQARSQEQVSARVRPSASTAAPHATPAHLEFNGIAIGTHLTQVPLELYFCGPDRSQPPGSKLTLCMQEISLPDMSQRMSGSQPRKFSIGFDFSDDICTSFNVSYAPTVYEDVVSYFSSVLGSPPHDSYSKQEKLLDGASVSTPHSIWHLDTGGVLMLRKFGSRASRGAGIYLASPKEIPSHRSDLSVAGAAMPEKPKAGAAALTVKSFSATGLSHEETLAALYRGAFADVEFNREDLMFEVLFRNYLNAYAKKCSAHLPANKVEITTQECATERVTRNGFGVELSRVCVEYVSVGTGLYADPELYAAKKEVDRILAADTLRQTWRILLMAQKDPLSGPMSMASAAQAIADDMSALVQMNDCASPGLRRFEENLRLFALNQQPIRLDGEAKSALAAAEAAGKALTEQDYERLIEELVADQAKSWAVNRYIHGSVGNVSVSSRDAAGRPSRVEASYSYDGFNGRSRGSVELHFTEGSPDCLFFSDAPSACRTPNRKIATSFFTSVTGSRTELSTRDASASLSASVVPADEPAAVEPPVAARVAAPVEPPPPLAPKRKLRAVNYIQGIKDACLEVLTGGDRREPETSYCFCLSASAGSLPVSDADAQWLFENFGDEALAELERRYAGLVRRFASCRAQFEANRGE